MAGYLNDWMTRFWNSTFAPAVIGIQREKVLKFFSPNHNLHRNPFQSTEWLFPAKTSSSTWPLNLRLSMLTSLWPRSWRYIYTFVKQCLIYEHLWNGAILNLQKVLNQSLAGKLANDVLISPDRFHDVKVDKSRFKHHLIRVIIWFKGDLQQQNKEGACKLFRVEGNDRRRKPARLHQRTLWRQGLSNHWVINDHDKNHWVIMI